MHSVNSTAITLSVFRVFKTPTLTMQEIQLTIFDVCLLLIIYIPF